MKLTLVQLEELTLLTNRRRDEFGPEVLQPLTAGDVRQVLDVYDEWLSDEDSPVDQGLLLAAKEAARQAGTSAEQAVAQTAESMAVCQPMRNEVASDVIRANGNHLSEHVIVPRQIVNRLVADVVERLVSPPAQAALGDEPITEPAADTPAEPSPAPPQKSVEKSISELERPIGRGRDAALVVERAQTNIPTPALKTPRTMKEVELSAKHKAELQEIIAAMRAMAVDGKMPTIQEWEDDHPKHLPVWLTIQGRYNVLTWRQMAELCGLEYAGTRGPRVHGNEPSKRQRKRDWKEREADKKAAAPTLDEVIAELKRQSMAGVMPTQQQFNLAKPAVWATANAHCMRLKINWPTLGEMAGLKPNPRGGSAAT